MRPNRHRRIGGGLAAAVAAGLALSACTAEADQSGETRTTAEAPAPSETPTTTALMPAGTGDPFADARTAAAHMAPTALTLATGLATATGTAGDPASPAAELRATLTALLEEHVYLAGYAVATAYVAGADSAEFEAAAGTLDMNSQDLAAAIASLAGEEQGAAFLELWRQHIGFFVDYAVAVKSGDQAGADAAQQNLMGYTAQAGAFFEQVSAGQLPAAAVAEGLAGHVSTLSAAIDALAAGDPTAPALLKDAAGHVVMAAGTFAGGFDAALDLDGDPADGASELRSGLTALLTEHVYLAGLAVFTAYTAEGGPDSDAFAGAAGALDANSVALSDAVASLAGPEQGTAFLELWREHIGFFVDYAVAVAADDSAAAEAALTDLDGYRPQAGAFFEEVSGGELPADDVAEGLRVHVETLAGAIDSLAGALVP